MWVDERFADPDRGDLDGLIERLEQMAPDSTLKGSGPVISARYRVGETVIETIVSVARFSSATHLGLDELRVELVYPMDEVGERFFASLDAA